MRRPWEGEIEAWQGFIMKYACLQPQKAMYMFQERSGEHSWQQGRQPQSPKHQSGALLRLLPQHSSTQ